MSRKPPFRSNGDTGGSKALRGALDLGSFVFELNLQRELTSEVEFGTGASIQPGFG
jgi:hypothetical protein